MNSDSKKIKIIFAGRYNPEEVLAGPEKVAKRIYTGISSKTNSIFIEYFFDGLKYNVWNKLFGYEKIQNDQSLEIYRLGIFRMICFVLKFKPNLVHLLTFQRFSTIFYLLKIFSHFKISYTVHSIVAYENSSFQREITLSLKIKDKISEWVIIKYSDNYFFLSKQSIILAKQFYTIKEEKIIKIFNGVDEVFHTVFNNRQYFVKSILNVVLVSDSNRIEKGLDFFLEAIEPIKEYFNIFIIGENHSKPIKNVKFISKMKTEDFARFLIEQEVFISSSVFDSFPISVIEAMATGVIPVITKQTGVSSFIEDGHNGFLFEYGDKLSLGTEI